MPPNDPIHVRAPAAPGAAGGFTPLPPQEERAKLADDARSATEKRAEDAARRPAQIAKIMRKADRDAKAADDMLRATEDPAVRKAFEERQARERDPAEIARRMRRPQG